MRRFITGVLGDEYRIVPAADGAEALAKALAEPPDLVVTDLMMPKLGGDRLIAEMRGRGPLAQVPVLVLSAKADEDMRLQLLAESVQDYVIKPFSAHELRGRVRNLVTMKRARDALQQELATQNEDLWQLTQELVASRQTLQHSLEAQQKSEQRWRAVFDNSAVGIGVTDVNGRLLEANPALQRFLGYSGEALRHMGLMELTPEDDREATRSRIAELLEGRLDEHHVERRYLRREGSVVWGNTSVSVIPGTGSTPHMLVGIVEDVTARKRSEQRLAAQYAITRVLAESDTIADAMPHLLQAIGDSMAWEWGALWNVDRDAGVLRCESLWHAPTMEAAEFDAVSREAVVIPGQGLKGRVWQRAEPTWIDNVSQAPNIRRAPIAARLGLRGAIAFPILLRGEATGIMEFFSRVVQEPDDEQLVTLSAIGSQIGQFMERKRLEDEQRKLASLVENSTDFIGLASPEGHALFVNAAGQKMVGLEGDEHVRATRVLDYVVAEEQPRFERQVLPTVIRHGHWEGETQFRHFQTGAAIPMLQHLFCIQEAGGDRPIALATISRDITESKQAEEALREAQAALAHVTRVMTLGELAASIAHEVNQPLTAVINNGNACLRWLARQSPDLEGVREALADIIANGQRASDVIARIRAALKKAPTQTERLEINHLIAEVIALTYHEVQRHGVRVHTELASDLPAVLGDRVQLQQVLLNLVMNGIDAMSTVRERPRQLLMRTTSAEPEGVLVAVQDSGIGLDPHMLERIFDAFYSTKPTGMGMGLSISRTIIKAHGGRLWAEQNPGPGATVQFILPKATENQDV
jgi:PAS domain S-box-containing protein